MIFHCCGGESSEARADIFFVGLDITDALQISVHLVLPLEDFVLEVMKNLASASIDERSHLGGHFFHTIADVLLDGILVSESHRLLRLIFLQFLAEEGHLLLASCRFLLHPYFEVLSLTQNGLLGSSHPVIELWFSSERGGCRRRSLEVGEATFNTSHLTPYEDFTDALDLLGGVKLGFRHGSCLAVFNFLRPLR